MVRPEFKFHLPVSSKVTLTEIHEDDRSALKEYLSEKEIFLQTFAMPYPYGDVEADWFLERMREKFLTEIKPTTLAIRRACQIAFKDFGVERVYAKAFARNVGSRRVLEKVGFQQEGLLRKDTLKEGELLDVALFGLLKNRVKILD